MLACLLLLAQGGAWGASTLYVDLNNPTPTAPYTSWATAATTIQGAVDAASDGDEIVVTNGVYPTGARDVVGMSNRVAVTKSVTVRSVSGPAATLIIGHQEAEWKIGPTAVRCVSLTNGAVLAGFTLTKSRRGFMRRRRKWCDSRPPSSPARGLTRLPLVRAAPFCCAEFFLRLPNTLKSAANSSPTTSPTNRQRDY